MARPQTRLHVFILSLSLLAFLALGWRGRQPTEMGDEPTYLALSQAVERGTYRNIHLAEPGWHIQYPPLYPAWLAGLRRVTGGNLDALRLANLVLVAGSLLLLFGPISQVASPSLALALVILLGLNRSLLHIAGSIWSEGLYLVLSTGALVVAFSPDPRSRGRGIAAMALALLAFLTRTAALPLLLAIGIWVWARRRRSELLAYATALLVVVGGWFLYTVLAAGEASGRSYLTHFADLGNGAGSGILGSLERTAVTALNLATRDVPYALSLPTIPGTWVDNLFWLGLCLVLLPAGLLVLWRSWPAAAAYLVFYLGLVLLWPWPSERLLAPVVPFLLLLLLLGASRLTERWRRPVRQAAMVALLALAGLGALWGALQRDALLRSCDRANPLASPGCYPEETRNFGAAALYLRQHALPGEPIVTGRPAGTYFLTGHPAVHSDRIRDAVALRGVDALRARGVRLTLLSRLLSENSLPFARALYAHCGTLRVEASFPPHALVLSTEGAGAPENACPSLEGFVRTSRPDPRPRRR